MNLPASANTADAENSTAQGAPAAGTHSAATGTPVFVVRELAKTYHTEAGPVHALRGVDFEVMQGEFVVLLGPSGSGKSTFLNILGGLDVPSSGQALFRGEDLATFSDSMRTEYRRVRAGFVFQFYNLIPSLTAVENVTLAAEIARDPLSSKQALSLVGLAHRMDHFPAELSGGEQQRVAVARAIAKRPDVLLCDEPTGALDSKTGVVVLEALKRATEAVGTTTVLISHNAAIGDMANRVVSFADGRIVGSRSNPAPRPPSELSW